MTHDCVEVCFASGSDYPVAVQLIGKPGWGGVTFSLLAIKGMSPPKESIQ